MTKIGWTREKCLGPADTGGTEFIKIVYVIFVVNIGRLWIWRGGIVWLETFLVHLVGATNL